MLRLWPLLALALAWLVPTATQAQERLRLWHAYRGAEEQALQQIVAEFDGSVEVLAVPYDAYGSKLASSIPLGEGPHLYIDAHERLGDYRARQIVAPWPGTNLDEGYVEPATQAVMHEGRVWALPLSLKSLALYVNEDLVAEPPATLEEIERLRGTLGDDVVPLAYEAQSAYAHAALLSAFGGRLFDDETSSYAFVGPAAERSLRRVQALISNGVVVPDADGALVTDLFKSGRAGLAISGPWLASDLDSTGPTVRYRVVPLPRVESEGAPMRPLLTVEVAMLSPEGARRDDAAALARHLASRPSALVRATVARSVSARVDVDPSDDPLVAAFDKQARTAELMPTSEAMRAAWEPANRAIRKVLRGDMPPEAALREGLHRFEDVRRPPPSRRSPTPWVIALGVFSLIGALQLVRTARTAGMRAQLRRSLPAYAYVALGVVSIGALVVVPIVCGALASLFAGPVHSMHFVGLANYAEILTARGGDLLGTGSFYVVLAVTVLWTIVNVTLHLGIGVTLGLLLSRPAMRLRGLYRVLLIVPWAVPSYVTAMAWRGMFHRQFGAVNAAIATVCEWFGTSVEPISWFSRFSTAFAANVATNVWLGFPFMMVVTLGAIATIPADVLEAARVDGASRWQRLTRITLPMMRPALVPAAALGAIWTFNMFNVVFLVSGGDPDGTTDILVSEAYRWAFTRNAQYGYACAYAVLIFLLLLGAARVGIRSEASVSQRSSPRNVLESVLAHVVVLVAVGIAIYPVLWVVSLALSSSVVLEPRVLPIPTDPTLDHLREVSSTVQSASEGGGWLFGRQLANSIIVSLATAAVGTAIAIPTAYGFARFDFVGKRSSLGVLLATQMFPAVASAVPLYMLLDALHLLNSRTGLVLCYASTSIPFAVFQLRSVFESIPRELEEAAMIDGARRFEAFVRVVLPVARPAIAVTFLFAFMTAYNEFILAATLLSNESAFTLPVVLQQYVGEFDARWDLFAAGAIIVSAPVMLLFYQVQRHMVSGLSAGGVKG